MTSPFIVAIEGIDGAGKTTLVRQLAARWPLAPVRRLPSGRLFAATRGSTPDVRRLRLLLDCVTAVDRARRLPVPLVIFDRSALSTAVYNGCAAEVFGLVGENRPDLTILLDVTEDEARRRLTLRGGDPHIDQLHDLNIGYEDLEDLAVRDYNWRIEVVPSDDTTADVVIARIERELYERFSRMVGEPSIGETSIGETSK